MSKKDTVQGFFYAVAVIGGLATGLIFLGKATATAVVVAPSVVPVAPVAPVVTPAPTDKILECSYIQKYLEEEDTKPMHFLECTVLVDHLSIQNIVVNRGNCKAAYSLILTYIGSPIEYKKQYKFGEVFRFGSLTNKANGGIFDWLNECRPIELEFNTDQGTLGLRFQNL